MIDGLPEKLRRLRQQYGYSQKRVANTLGVSPSVVSGYETGERTPSTEVLLAISSLYQCSVDYLLGKKSIEPSKTLCIEGLTIEQVQALQALIESIKKDM